MKQLNYISFIALVMILCCNQPTNDASLKKTPNSEVPKTPIRAEHPFMEHRLFDSLIDAAIERGDEKAYNNAVHTMILKNRGTQVFYYSMLMANKYDCPQACYHVYELLVDYGPQSAERMLKTMDEKTKKIALYNLLKSYELGYESSRPIEKIHEIFGINGRIPKSSEYQ
jgi:hypothetical protein